MCDVYSLTKTHTSLFKPVAMSRSEKVSQRRVSIKTRLKLFHGLRCHPVGENVCAQSFWDVDQTYFCMSHQYFKDAKVMQTNIILK